MKKLLLFIAFAILGLGLNAQSVTIDYGDYSLEFSLDYYGECYVSGYSGTSTNVTVPSLVKIEGNEYSVTSIGNSAFRYCNLTSIEIPSSVTSIGNYAFYECSLTSITFGENSQLTSIGNSAFEYCNLTSIEIPSSVTSIGNYAFYECSLTSITFGENSQLTSIGNSAFEYCNLTSIEIPSSVTSIGNYAFSSYNLKYIRCYALSVPYTGNYVFGSNIQNIQVPESSVDLYRAAYDWKDYNITRIHPYFMEEKILIDYGEYSLTYATKEDFECSVITSTTAPNTLSNITIPSTISFDGMEFTVTSIESSAFYGSKTLNCITIPNTVKSLLSYTWREDGLGPTGDDYQTYYKGTFEDCSNLKSITFGDNSCLTTIGDESFRGCTSLTDINLPYTVQYMGGAAFYNCSSLTNIVIPSGVSTFSSTSICDDFYFYTSTYYGTFENCSNLRSITFSDFNQLFNIGSNAFKNCSNLKSIKCHSSVIPTTSTSAFYNCPSNMIIQVPSESVELYKSSSPWYNYEIKAGFNSTITTSSNIEYGGSVSWGGTYQDGTTLTITAIPNIGYYFKNWSENGKIISENQEFSFIVDHDRELIANFVEDPNILGINNDTIINYNGYALEYTVTNISPAECEVVCHTQPAVETSIIVPTTVRIKGIDCNVTSIGNDAFYECKYLTNITIPQNVTSIGDEAFCGCNNLKNIEIPNSVVFIGEYVFEDCFRLESIIVESGCQKYDSRDNCNAIIETSTDVLLYGCMNTIIPNNVVSIGEGAFCGCSNLKNILIPNSVTSIGAIAFAGCSNLSSIKIPNSVTSIGGEAFSGCKKLISVEIPNSVTSIGGAAFSSCSSLTSIKIPNSVTVLPDYVFGGCSKLTNIEIPNSIISIEDLVFTSCSSLTSIKIPSSVESIGYRAFNNCSKLTIIKCHSAIVPATDFEVFEGCPSNMTIYVPQKSIKTYEAIEPWNLYNIQPIGSTETPKKLSITSINESSISLNWEEDENAESYNIYRDGIFVTNITSTNYTDNNLKSNTEYCYTVSAENEDNESEQSEKVCAKTLGESIDELSSSTNIYPNPVDNELFLATEVRVEEIAIYDVYGRTTTVYGLQTTDFVHSIDVADLEAGVYFVKIKTENGNVVKRFVKN